MRRSLRSKTKDVGGARHQPFFRKLTSSQEEFKKFKTTVWRFSVETKDPINITLTEDSKQEDVNKTFDTVHELLKGCLENVFDDSGYGDGFVQLSMEMNEGEFQFNYNAAGPSAVTLREFLKDEKLDQVVTELSLKIQSGQEVFIDDSTVVTIYLYENKSGGASKRVKCGNKEEFMRRSQSVIAIENTEDHSCAARAIMCGIAKKTMTQAQFRIYRKDMMRSNNSRNKREAYELLEQVGISPFQKCHEVQLVQMADHLQIGIHVLECTDVTKPEFSSHYEPEGASHKIYLARLHEHYNLVVDPRAFLRNFAGDSDRLQLCGECHDTYYDVHQCGESQQQKRQRRGRIWAECGTTVENATQFIETLAPKPKSDKKLIFYDFETFPEPIPKHPHTPPHPEDPEVDRRGWGVNKDGSRKPYYPIPFIQKNMDHENYIYRQKVFMVCAQEEDGTSYTFPGLDEFIEFIMLPENEGALLIAHYSSGFDGQFLLREAIGGKHFVHGNTKPPVLKGQKIMTAQVQNHCRLIDSYNFVGAPLSSFTKIFDLNPEYSKGYFPHLFSCSKNMGVIGPIPAAEYYQPNQMSEAGRKKFLEWHHEQVENKVKFDFRKDCESYCQMDVTVLREGMLALREKFLNLEDGNGRSLSMDIFNYVTIPSVCYALFRTYFLQPDTIATVIPPREQQYSAESIRWLEYEAEKRGVIIRHALSGGEVVINGIPVDGHYTCPQSGKEIILQYMGCYFHGCSFCYSPETLNKMKSKTFINRKGEEQTVNIKMGSLDLHTKEMVRKLERMGYEVIVMYECRWKKIAKKENVPPLREELLHLEPLNPRHGYYGGRVEALAMMYEAEEDENIYYDDVTSMFPSVMENEEFPIGPVTILKRGDGFIAMENLMGMAKVKVKAPDDIHLPVLPYRSPQGKIMFAKGTFIGTWTSVELQLAMSQGYEILEIYEQHHFPRATRELFKPYVNTFFDLKKKAEEEGNTGLKQVAKICLNSFYGKLAQNSWNQREVRLIENYADMAQHLFGKFEEVSVTLLSENKGYATITKPQTIMERSDSNVYLAAFITAYSRVKLYKEGFLSTGRNLLYCDTDSVVYRTKNKERLIPIDGTGALGGWESELPDEDDYFVSFVSSGPKSYSLISKSRKTNITKSKGFTLHFENRKIFNHASLQEQVIAKATQNEDVEKLVMHTGEHQMVRNFFNIEMKTHKGKKCNLVFDKRNIDEPEYFEDGRVKSITTSPVTLTI